MLVLHPPMSPVFLSNYNLSLYSESISSKPSTNIKLLLLIQIYSYFSDYLYYFLELVIFLHGFRLCKYIAINIIWYWLSQKEPDWMIHWDCPFCFILFISFLRISGLFKIWNNCGNPTILLRWWFVCRYISDPKSNKTSFCHWNANNSNFCHV